MSAIFNITDNAASRIAFLMGQEGAGAMLRVAVDGGGCSGFQYRYEFVKETAPDNQKIEKNGAIVLVDEVSLDMLNDSELDFIENLGGSYFEIRNPNATAKCGCGNSFSL